MEDAGQGDNGYFRKCAVVLVKLALLIPNMMVDAVCKEKVGCTSI